MRGCGLLALAIALLAATPSRAAPLLPDLVSDPPGDAQPPGIYSDDAGNRLLMRFDGFIHNRGAGALELRGSSPFDGLMTDVRQRIYDSDGGFGDVANTPAPTLIFETNDDHDHWHLRNAAEYSLWNEERSAPVAPAMKVGFCLTDSLHVDPYGPPAEVYSIEATHFCGQGEPQGPTVFMGISAGWRDLYDSSLAFQWVDISDVPPGRYWLRSQVDPGGVIQESDEVNPPAFGESPAVIQGYRARPVDLGRVPPLAPTVIRLRADRFDDPWPGGPAAPEFRIDSPPAHGLLAAPTGRWSTLPYVVYLPDPGYLGPDSFRFSARQGSSPFPLHPPSAAVTFTVGQGAAARIPAISGSPSRLSGGSGVQLRAADSPVSWTVDGIAGGDAGVGTITPGGLYVAPPFPPRGRAVRIGATSARGLRDQVSVVIVGARIPRPAPDLPGPAGRAGRYGLARPRIRRTGREVLLQTVPGRTGRLTVTLVRGSRRLGGCGAPALARRPVTCRIRLRRPLGPGRRGLRVVVTLRARGRVVAQRRAALGY